MNQWWIEFSPSLSVSLSIFFSISSSLFLTIFQINTFFLKPLLKESQKPSKIIWKVPPKSGLQWVQLFHSFPLQWRKSFSHHHYYNTFSFRHSENQENNHILKCLSKTSFTGTAHALCLFPLQLKTVIKSLFRLHSSGLNQPDPLDVHHRTGFSNLF